MLLTKAKGFLSLANAKIYWLFVALCGLYVAFGEINTPAYMMPTMAALIAAGLVLHQVNYNWISFVSIFTFTHVIAFPVGVLLTLSVSHPSLAIETELWETTPLSLWGMVVGMCGLILGILLARVRLVHTPTRNSNDLPRQILTPVWFNMGLVSLIVPIVIVYLNMGIYYHSNVTGVDEYDLKNATSLGFVGYLTYLTYGGVVLQIRRYLLTKCKRDLRYAVLCFLLPLVAMLPSGSRANTLIIGVIALLYFLKMETRPKVKYVVLSIAIMLFLSLMLSIEAYRISTLSRDATSFAERLELVVKDIGPTEKADSNRGEAAEIGRALLARRLSDLHSVGYLMSIIPEDYPHRGFEEMLDFGYYLLPTVFRPTVSLSFSYDALLMEKYGFRTDIGGSSPMMIIGDLYERFGWLGIFLGMACIGLLLTHLDRWISSNTINATLMWAMLFFGILNMSTYSLLTAFTLATRQLIIFMIIIYILDSILYTFSGIRFKAPNRVTRHSIG